MKIGLIDSGIGGLSVLNAFIAEHVNADYYYIADTGHLPYGSKTNNYIDNRIDRLTHFLKDEIQVDAIIIACNTATAVSASRLRMQFPNFPIVGIEPAIKPATLLTQTKHIAVAATESTLNSKRFAYLIETFAQDITVHTIQGGSWVELVEQGHLNDQKAHNVIQQSLAPLGSFPVDQFILGCTHFPFLSKTIEAHLHALYQPRYQNDRNNHDHPINIINPAVSIVTRTLSLLESSLLHDKANNSTSPNFHFYTTGNVDDFSQQLTLLGYQSYTQHCIAFLQQ